MTVRIAAGDGANLTLGTSWTLTVVSGDEPTVTVTLPDTSTAAAMVELLSGCTWLATYVTTAAGRHTAEVDAGVSGIAYASAFVTAVVAESGMPTIADLGSYLGTHSQTDDELQDALDAEAANQRKVCKVPAAYSADLRRALLRRAARALALLRLNVTTEVDGETGRSIVPPGLDREIRRYEAPYRRMPVG